VPDTKRYDLITSEGINTNTYSIGPTRSDGRKVHHREGLHGTPIRLIYEGKPAPFPIIPVGSRAAAKAALMMT
jgi:hypothetical protein